MYKIPINVDNKPLKSDHMKKKAQDIAFKLGCSTSYSGNTNTMYITGVNRQAAIAEIKQLHPLFIVKDGEW